MKAVAAVLLAMIAIAYSTGSQAASLSVVGTGIKSADISTVRLVSSKNGSIARSTGQLRTFRPSQVWRIRPTFGQNRVRPGYPLAHRSTTRPLDFEYKPHDQAAYRKRPRRPHHVHVAEGAAPEVPPAASEGERRDDSPMSPDFCRYWGDRGEVAPQWNLCW
jgi:hypothetical protein